MSFAQGIAGAGVALVIIAALLLHAASDSSLTPKAWKQRLTWGCAALIAGGFLIGLGAVG